MRDLDEPLPPARWPYHPQPRPFEPLALWIERVAWEYGVRFRTFCRYGLGMDHAAINVMCRQPTEPMLATLSAGTGVSIERLQAMSLSSLLAQLQAELDVARGAHEAIVVEWLKEKMFVGQRSDREYWETIEFWCHKKKCEYATTEKTFLNQSVVKS